MVNEGTGSRVQKGDITKEVERVFRHSEDSWWILEIFRGYLAMFAKRCKVVYTQWMLNLFAFLLFEDP